MQSALVTVKKARLDKIIGTIREEKEEKPEGEVLGDDSTGNSICPLFFYYFTKQIHFSISFYCFLQLSSLDESEEEERTRPTTKEEEDVDVLQSWMEGWEAFQLTLKRRCKGAFGRGKFIPLFFPCCLPLSISYLLSILPSQSWHWIVIGYFLLLFRG